MLMGRNWVWSGLVLQTWVLVCKPRLSPAKPCAVAQLSRGRGRTARQSIFAQTLLIQYPKKIAKENRLADIIGAESVMQG